MKKKTNMAVDTAIHDKIAKLAKTLNMSVFEVTEKLLLSALNQL